MPATVLVADDEPALRALVIHALEDAGYQTIEAPDGREAWNLLRRRDTRIDLVLTDVVMPNLTGTELAALIRENLPHIPVILVSAYAPGDLRARGIAPVEEVITKPFQIDDLVRHVESVLAEHRPPGS